MHDGIFTGLLRRVCTGHVGNRHPALIELSLLQHPHCCCVATKKTHVNLNMQMALVIINHDDFIFSFALA